MIEFVPLSRAEALDRFVTGHLRGHYMQTSLWGRARPEWQWLGVILRGRNREILATAALLYRDSRLPGRRFFYIPRGPVFSTLSHYRELMAFLIPWVRSQGGYILRCDPAVSAADREFRDLAEELGYRFDPRADFSTFQPKVVHQIQLANLTDEELLAEFHPKTRYNIRLAQRRGVTVHQAGTEQLWIFCRLMEQTAKRAGFQPRSERFFRNLLLAGENEVSLLLAERKGEYIAGAIEVIQGNRAWYAYGCSADEGRRDMPNVLLQWEMMRRALRSGCTVYDMRGVEWIPDGEGLQRFKQSFGGQQVEYAGQMDLVLRPLAWRLHWGKAYLHNYFRHRWNA
ncbi:MAG: aminoacyltransferase [Ruminococcaceae bacterium]|nr:aminoacyltransferase [Oscillospiraceae bacterium]